MATATTQVMATAVMQVMATAMRLRATKRAMVRAAMAMAKVTRVVGNK